VPIRSLSMKRAGLSTFRSAVPADPARRSA
jgi:hypothetical protein